jgi:hypothetical protein
VELLRTEVSRIETPLAWVFLDEREAWKFKKPLHVGSIDWRTPTARRDACEAEARLGRRLAPGVHRGVEPVRETPDGRRRLAGTGPVVDWVLRMARLPNGHRADERLRAGRLEEGEVARLAQHLAVLHDAAHLDPGASRHAGPDAIARRVGSILGEEPHQIATEQKSFLEAHRDWFEARITSGRVREGHGDLHLENVWIDDAGAVLMLGCAEGIESQQGGDVCAEVAGLSVDLAGRGRTDLAERLLADYAGASDDYALYRVVDFYERDRTCQRARLQALLADDPRAKTAERASAARQIRRLHQLACATARRPLLPPALVALGGLVASGKSTLARALASRLAAPRVVSDHTRDILLGDTLSRKVHEANWAESLAPGFENAVYDAILQRAELVLDSGRSAVLDGCFGSVRHRRAARALAHRHRVPFRFVECRVDAGTAQRRLAERDVAEPEGHRGWGSIYDALAVRWEPADEIAPEEHVVLDTARPLEESVAAIEAQLPLWPAQWRA